MVRCTGRLPANLFFLMKMRMVRLTRRRKKSAQWINPLDLSTDSSQTEEKKQGVSLQWYIGVIAAVVILGTAGVIIYRRKAKQHEQE